MITTRFFKRSGSCCFILILMIILLIPYQQTSGQGSYVQFKDEISHGLRLINDPDSNYLSCRVMIDNEIISYAPGEVLEYKFPGDSVFEFHVIPFKYADDSVFLYRAYKGKPSLLVYRGNKIRLFAKSENEPVELIRKRKKFRDQLESYFPEHPYSDRDITFVNYNEASVINYIKVGESNHWSPPNHATVNFGFSLGWIAAQSARGWKINPGYDIPANLMTYSLFADYPISTYDIYLSSSFHLQRFFNDGVSLKMLNIDQGVNYTAPFRFARTFLGADFGVMIPIDDSDMFKDDSEILFLGSNFSTGLKIPLYNNLQIILKYSYKVYRQLGNVGSEIILTGNTFQVAIGI